MISSVVANRDLAHAQAHLRHGSAEEVLAWTYMRFRRVALVASSKEPEAARAMIEFMTSSEAAPLLRKTHVEPAKAL